MSFKTYFFKILNLLKVLLITVVMLYLTTYGWQTSKKYPLVVTPEKQETAENLRQIVTHLSLEIGNRNFSDYDQLTQAAEFIRGRFEALGYTVTEMPFEVEGRIYKNVVVEKKAASATRDVLVVGAHYDTCFTPGADDNASGVAVLIELARLLKNIPLKYNVTLAAFANEEAPFFMTENMGSRVFVRRAKEQGANIKGAIILEMLGYYSDRMFSQRYFPLMGIFYPHRGNFVALVGDIWSYRFVKRLAKDFRKVTLFPVEWIAVPRSLPETNLSDHWSFWKEGLPAVMVTDTAYLRNPHYHGPSDTPSTLDYTKMAIVAHGLRETLLRLKF